MPQTWTEIQDFPVGILITGCEITADNAVGVRTGPGSYKQEVFVSPGQRLRMTLSLRSHSPELGSELEAWMLSLRGSAGIFRFGDPFHSLPMGQAKGAPIIETDATAGSQTIQTSGWAIGRRDCQLATGDYIQIKDQLYRVLSQVDSDMAGNAEITVWPNLRENLVTGEQVITHNPRGLWRLQNSSSSYGRRAAGQRHITELSFVEAL